MKRGLPDIHNMAKKIIFASYKTLDMTCNLSTAQRSSIIELMKREIVPAIGCTEPIAVALCAARAAEVLGKRPERISVLLSANMLKNAMGVGIPGTNGMIGLPIAVALGAMCGKSEYGLEVLRGVTAECVEEGRKFIDSGAITVGLKQGQCDILYIEVEASAGSDSALAVIEGSHTCFTRIQRNGETLEEKVKGGAASACGEECVLDLRKVFDFASTAPIEELDFILKAAEMNKKAAEISFTGDYGHSLGRLLRGDVQRSVIGDGVFSRILSYTSGACDARMSGAQIAVMSNSGSGNQGITATLPVVVYAEQTGASEEQKIRALILSNLTVIYIKQSLGRLSALCGCVVAATGSSCGITYLMGGGYDEVSYAVKNMIANLAGMICDGAKPSCSMKVASGISTAVLSALLAMEHRCVSSAEGIIDEDVDRSILNLTKIGREGMTQTDRMILDIMTTKRS